MGPTIHSITRHAGIAGQYAISAVVEYPDELRQTVTFTGSVYGGPIVMSRAAGIETFVSSDVTDRLGQELTEDWVRRFFA